MWTLIPLEHDLLLKVTNALAISAGLIGCWASWRFVQMILRTYRSPLRLVPGPPSDSIFLGHLMKLLGDEPQETFYGWQQTYGHVFAFTAFLGSRRGVTTDNKALAHILSNTTIYYKPEASRYQLSELLGDGLVTVEGAGHRHQRRALNPAFNTNHLRDALPTFLQKSAELCDALQTQIAPGAASARINVLHWLSRAAIDIIGLAGFNYDFNTLQVGEDGNELAAAFHDLNSPKKLPLFFILKGFLPFLRPFAFDEQSQNNQKARAIMRDIGLKLIAEKGKEPTEEEGKNTADIGTDQDLLSRIIRLNMSNSAQEKLSEEQLLDQIPTFLTAGQETTATGLAWCLFSLGQEKAIQARLREELVQAFPDDASTITMEALNSLPYLDAIVRETLRLNPPLDGTVRVAMQDDIVPLEKPFVRTDGKEVDHIQVKKGDHWIIPILNINRSKEIWGEDCQEFNPDRWLHELPPAAAPVPALWSSIMTFLGGPRSCIGYRFAIMEMKAILLYLIRAFEFELPVDPKDITHKSMITTRPALRSEPDKGSQLPMIVRPIAA
ncbi:cytochrome P450 [Serendipita vermifera]|nr:cytochrome P450 [Serendipita vermifera]